MPFNYRFRNPTGRKTPSFIAALKQEVCDDDEPSTTILPVHGSEEDFEMIQQIMEHLNKKEDKVTKRDEKIKQLLLELEKKTSENSALITTVSEQALTIDKLNMELEAEKQKISVEWDQKRKSIEPHLKAIMGVIVSSDEEVAVPVGANPDPQMAIKNEDDTNVEEPRGEETPTYDMKQWKELIFLHGNASNDRDGTSSQVGSQSASGLKRSAEEDGEENMRKKST